MPDQDKSVRALRGAVICFVNRMIGWKQISDGVFNIDLADGNTN